MKQAIFVAVIFALVPALANAQARNWDFVEAIGGLSLSLPRLENGIWHLPTSADVSGLRGGATRLNSGIACDKIKVAVEGRTIALTVVTRMAGPGSSAVCPAAKLGKLSDGDYLVFYRSTGEADRDLGQIRLEAGDKDV